MEISENDYSPLLEDKEEDNNFSEDQITRKLRKGFIAKVFGIVLYQIIIVFLVVLLGFFNNTIRRWLLTSTLGLILSVIISFSCLLIPICFPIVYEKVPTNYILLTIFTLSDGWIVAAFTVQYTATSVLTALFLTIVMVSCITIYAFKTKTDFTVFGGVLFTALILLIVCGIILIFVRIRILYLIYIYGGLILFCLYLLYDVQLLIGKGENKFDDDDYILAAINIYIDIIAIFIRILAIIGTKNN